MSKLSMFRLAFQMVALGIFIFQMQQSLRKFLSYPVVKEVSTKLAIEYPDVPIYICQGKVIESNATIRYKSNKELHGFKETFYPSCWLVYISQSVHNFYGGLYRSKWCYW